MHRRPSLFVKTLILGFLCVPFVAVAQAGAVSTQEYQALVDKLLSDQKQQLLNATSLQQNVTGSTLDVKINPQAPEPSVPVTISVESYLVDLNKATMSWSLNNKIVLQGVGNTSFTFQNGEGGQTTMVSLTIVANTGEVIKKDFSFTPASVTTLWEADTYTPPFYKGKAMMVPQANVRIIAVPNSSNVTDTDKLVYTWSKDGYVDPGASGYGKNVFSFTGPDPLTSTKVILSVSSIDDKVQSESRVYLPQKRPFILFYEKDPLLGVLYNKPLGTDYSLTTKELSLSAEPYFFSNEREVSQPLKYAWTINGGAIKNYGREITLRNDGSSKGSSLLSLVMRGTAQDYQTAERKLLINFNDAGSSRPIF